MPTEPIPTAILLSTLGILMIGSVLLSRPSGRVGVPALVAFVAIGMLAGSDGVGGIVFEDYAFTFRLGTAALALILFDGGLNTRLSLLKHAVRPAGILATIGVVGIAAATALGARLVGLPWREAFLLGATVSSTDAAAVFAILRQSGLRLDRRVGLTLELESGLNDPVAVLLTIAVTRALVEGGGLSWGLILQMPLQLAVGVAGGIAIGWAGRALVRRAHLPAGGLYPVLTLAIALVAFGFPTLAYGSGFLAVYVAGMIIGDGHLPHRASVLRVHDFVAWSSQVVMFVVLGLLSHPSRLAEAAWPGVGIALFLAIVARPVVVALLLLPFRYPAREIGYIGSVGLRGAVPIILATYPVLAGAPGAARLFDVVFFVVVVGAIVPGAMVRWLTRVFGLERRGPPPPEAAIEIDSKVPLKGEILSFFIDPSVAVAGARIADVPFPPGAAVMLVVRGEELVPAKGATVLAPGDHVFVFCRPEDRALLGLLFGRLAE